MLNARRVVADSESFELALLVEFVHTLERYFIRRSAIRRM